MKVAQRYSASCPSVSSCLFRFVFFSRLHPSNLKCQFNISNLYGARLSTAKISIGVFGFLLHAFFLAEHLRPKVDNYFVGGFSTKGAEC